MSCQFTQAGNVKDVKAAYSALGKAVRKASGGSALHGLEIVAVAFAAVLDTYASPNALNPEGMCDDPRVFRQHFVALITNAGGPGGPK
jgi:hypothetical protein